MGFEIAKNPTTPSVDAPKRRPWAGYIAALAALVLCQAQGSSARADSASCMANVSLYVAELDALLSKETDSLRAFFDLEERYLPFRDCEAHAFLEVVSRSSFLRSISYRSGQY